MSSKYALSVSLTEHLCAFIRQEVGSGRYGTASEVVRTGLRLLEKEANLARSAIAQPKASSEAQQRARRTVP
jgi:antitoxin ParD1/3/4